MTYRSELYLIKSDNTEIPANIIANTLYLNKSYCEEEQLEIGGCIPSQFKCSVYGIEDITDIVKLKYIRYSNDEPDISFEGIIEELTSTSNDGIYNITAYDVLYNQNDISEWYNNYMANNQDVTISQLYSAVLGKLGLTSGSIITNYITYDFVIKQNILSNNITGTRLLKWICEALGLFGILNTYTSTNETENGIRYTTMTTFSLNVLGPKPKTAISPTSVFSGFQKSDYICKKIDKVQIRSEEEDIGAIYGTGTNALIIEGNPLFYGMDASELEKCAKQISSNIKDNSDYTAYEAELADSDSYINNVDIYQCYPISSSTVQIYSYIFNITWSGSQLTTCKIGANGVETRSEVLTSTNSEIIKLNYKTTSIVKNVDGIKTEVSSISSKANDAVEKADKALTSIEQTDKYIETKVVKNDEVVAKINASQEGVNIKADKISLEGYTTINDNFKIDEKGNMEANNGKFSGEITTTSGTIGGWSIQDTYLYQTHGEYTAFIQVPISNDTWVFSAQKKNPSGSGNIGTWYVTVAGDTYQAGDAIIHGSSFVGLVNTVSDLSKTVKNIRGQGWVNINDRLTTKLSGTNLSIWSQTKEFNHGLYVVMVSAIIHTSKNTSNIRFYVGNDVVASGLTNSTTDTRVIAVGSFGITGTHKKWLELRAESQDSGTTVTVPTYQTYNILIFKVG